jgi:hypothetical protein
LLTATAILLDISYYNHTATRVTLSIAPPCLDHRRLEGWSAIFDRAAISVAATWSSLSVCWTSANHCPSVVAAAGQTSADRRPSASPLHQIAAAVVLLDF